MTIVSLNVSDIGLRFIFEGLVTKYIPDLAKTRLITAFEKSVISCHEEISILYHVSLK